MQEVTDIDLLRQYAEGRSEKAFGELVARHINTVYSTALRQTRNPSQAEEITQAVFVVLARKASSLLRHTFISGWLYQTTRLTAITFLRSELRRARREQEAYMQATLDSTAGPAQWEHLAPMLDDAMAALGARDRNALVLRFFDRKSMRDTGTALNTTEDAAKKRVGRALEKLRGFFTRRGLTLSAGILATLLSANAVHAAPASLATSVNAIAVSGGAATASTLGLANGVIKWMAWLKIKTAVLFGAAVLVAAGATTVTVRAWPSMPAAAQPVAVRHEAGWGTVIDPDGDCTLTFADKSLIVKVPGSDHVFMPERGRTNAPRVLEEVEGDFTVQVKVSGDFPTDVRTAARGRRPYQDGGLFLWLDAKNNFKLARAQIFVDGKPHPYLNGESRFLGALSSMGADPPELRGAPAVYLRLRRRGNTFEAGYSPNGRDWVSHELPPGPVPKKLMVGVIAQHNTYTPLTVKFEEFNLTRGDAN
jgi:RNA polymerase sigma factor (sigma-70 family)